MSDDKSLSSKSGDEKTAPGRREGTFEALRIPEFRWFWLSTLTSFFGLQMQSAAQLWLAYQLTNSPLQLSLVGVCWGVPIVIFSILSGVVIDRMQKRDMLRISQACMAAILLIVAILISTGRLQYWHLLMAAFCNGTAASIMFPASMSFLPEIISREKLYNGIALNNAAFNVTRIGGPALSGALIGIGGAAIAYYCAVGLFLLAVLANSMLPATSKIIVRAERSVIKELKEGLRYMGANNIILMLMMMEIAVNILGMPVQNLMPVFAGVFNLQALGYGLFMMMIGIGALIGSLAIATFGQYKGKGRVLIFFGIIYGIMLVLFANSANFGTAFNLGTGAVVIASVLLVVVGSMNTCYIATSSLLVQMNVTDEVRGRVMGIYGMVIGLNSLGSLPAGAIAESMGAPFAVTILGGILGAIMIVMLLANRRIRQLE